MVRPIEITDALSKAQQVGKLVQNALMRPEAGQEVEKAQNERRHTRQAQAPNPVPETDQVVLHVEGQEREKRRTPEDMMQRKRRRPGPDTPDEEDDEPHGGGHGGHIDITA